LSGHLIKSINWSKSITASALLVFCFTTNTGSCFPCLQEWSQKWYNVLNFSWFLHSNWYGIRRLAILLIFKSSPLDPFLPTFKSAGCKWGNAFNNLSLNKTCSFLPFCFLEICFTNSYLFCIFCNWSVCVCFFYNGIKYLFWRSNTSCYGSSHFDYINYSKLIIVVCFFCTCY